MSTETTVLVCFKKRNREVCFQGSTREALEKAIRSTFRDVLKEDSRLVLQMKSDRWNGMFVEINDYEAVVEGSIIEVIFDEISSDTVTHSCCGVSLEEENANFHQNDEEMLYEITAPLKKNLKCPLSSQISISSDDVGSKNNSERLVEEVRHQAIIFRKEPLNDYQIKVNEAAFEIALSQPNLLQKGQRGILLEQARKKVADDGYTFKKGISRSKVYGNPSSSKGTRLNQNLRQERMLEIDEELSSITTQLSFKNKRITQAEIVKDYKLCDRLTDEIQECNFRKRELERELKLLVQKEKKSTKKKCNAVLKEKSIRSSTPILSTSSCSNISSASPPATSVCSDQTSYNTSSDFNQNDRNLPFSSNGNDQDLNTTSESDPSFQ